MRKIVLGLVAATVLASPALAGRSGAGHHDNPYNFNYGYHGGFRQATPVDGYVPFYETRRVYVAPRHRYVPAPRY